MFSPLRNRFGIPGAISVIALVFAMLGGAYAASDNGGSGKATASKSKVVKGPRGPRGPAGPAGAAGPAGPAGAKGDTGAAGSNGSNGSNGASGKSVVTTSFDGGNEPAGEPCEELGGVQLEVEGTGVKKFVCNGEEGLPGADGSPWTLGGTLPAGSSETGVWSFGVVEDPPSGGAVVPWNIPLSFPIPLAAPLDESHVHFLAANGKEVNEEGEPVITPTACLGSAAAPTAAPGHLCVYTKILGNVSAEYAYVRDPSSTGGEELGASKAGAVLGVAFRNAKAFGSGTWAVRAPNTP